MSGKIQKTIEINAKVKASLEGMEKTVSDLEKGLEKQKFDLNKNSGLSKLIKDYKEAKAELDELMSGDVIARTDIKKAEQLGGKVSRLYKQIGKSFEDLRAGSDDTFRKFFPDSFTARISKGTKAIEGFFSKLDSKSVKEGRLDEARKDLARLDDELDGLKNRRLKIEVDVDKKGVKDELDRINKDLEQMRENFKKKLIPEEKRDSQGRTRTERLNSAVSTWSNKLTQDNDAKRNLKVQPLSKSQSSQISKLEGQLVDAQGASLADIEKKRLDALHAEQTKRATIAKTPGARDTSRNRREYGGVTDKELAAQIAASEKELQRLGAIVDKINDIKQQPQRAYDAAVKNLEKQIKTDRINLEKAERALEVRTTQKQNQEAAASQKADDFMAGKQVAKATQAETDALKALNNEKEKNLDLEKKLKEEKAFDSQKAKDSAIDKKNSSIKKKKLEIQELENTIKNLTNDTDFDAFFKKLKELGVNTEGIDKTRAGLEGIKKDLDTLDENTLKEIREALKKMGVDAKDTDTKVDTLAQGMEQLGDTDKDLKRAESEMENLKNQVLQFFSLTNAVQLFKRAVTSALNTVKELDATMTEAAVVTDFSVGDMWDKLPQYSAEAQKLGVSINGMYQATTLYYQQGLKTNEAMALGIETMKMGKIASMDSTEATKAMTAALRGFNMELNETSATRVNDVYSQLAAVTAADTNQIATAMEKTASIAAAANMEFETTAALLAQIIETTQEAPETAGTAMKTIIARFSEVKALQNQGEATGTDEEGESIDVNKIQTALKTVGISMDSFFAGTEGLDSILLKLAEKWGTLDFKTQRYVATMAAGSRQQSRFIAMMSDYGRTMELVDSANNSAGASQRQYEKTLDSMESKLQRLENAWNEFLMSLANNDILKGAVDFLTWIVEGINKMTDSISGGNGLIKSITSLITVIGALKLGKQAIGSTGFAQALGGLTGKAGTTKETITETKGPGDSIVRTIVKEPVKEGELAGQQAGQGFVAGFKRAVAAKKEGANVLGSMKAMFTTDVDKKAIERKYNDQGKKKLANAKNKKEFISELVARNSGAEEGQKIKTSVLKKEVLTVFETEGAEAAVAKYEQLGGSLRTVSENEKMAGEQSKTLGLNMNAMGQAAMGVGALLGGLSAIFEALGMEEAAEATSVLASVFMGLGTVMTTLSSIAPMLGISFTTAGVQIGAAGATAAAGGAAAITAWFPLIAIIGAIIAAVMIVIALFKAAKDASDEGQIEKLNEQIEALSTAADEAKNKLQEMASAKEELDKLQDAFQGLTKGSKEWKQALIENNQKVLELLDTYPQLAEYVSKGINGELTIAEEGWEKMQDQQQVAYTSALNAKTAKIQQKEEEELEFETRDFLLEARKKQSKKQGPSTQSTAVTTHSAADTTYAKTTQPSQPVQSTSRYITNDEMQAFAAAAAERGVSFSGGSGKEAFRQVFTDLRETGVIGEDVNFDTFYSQISNLGSSFDELANSAMATSLAEEARADSIAANVAQTSELVQSSKEFGMVAEEMGSQVFTDYDDRVVEVAKDYTSALSNESKPEYEDTLQEYADNQNMTLDEVKNQIKDGTLSKETIADTLAARDVDNQMKDVMEGTIKVLNKISVGKSKQEVAEIKSLMTDRGLGLGIKSIQNMPKTQEDMLAYLKKQGFSADDAKAMGYTKTDENGQIVGDLEAFSAAMLSNAQDASAAFENAFNNENTYGMGEEFKKQIVALNDQLVQLGSTTGLTVSQTQALANSLAKITANGGDTEALLQQFPNLLKGLSGNDLDNAINILSSTDWTTQNGIESTMQALESLGVTIDDQLTQQVYVATKAIKKLDLEAMEKKLSNLQSLIDNVEEKRESGSKIYTKEERDALVSNGFGEGQFVRTDIDEYVFMGDTNDLLSSIDDYVSQILDEMRGDVETAVEQGRKFESLFQSDRKYAVGDGTKGSITGKELTAEQIIQRLVTGEIDTLGMGGTNNVGRTTLVSLAHQTGVLDHVEGWEAEYSDWMIAETLKQAYTNTYGYGGVTLEQNEEKQSEINKETLTAEYARAAGTEEFWELYNEQNEKRRLIQNIEDTDTFFVIGLTKKQYGETHFGETDFGVISSRITDWKEGSIKAEADFNYGKLLESIANDQDFQEKYKDDVVVEHAMRALATNLNIENAHEMDFETLYAQLKNYQFEVNAAELALEAYIQKEAGLDIMIQQLAQDLGLSEEALAHNSKGIMQLAASINEANKKTKAFHNVLTDQIEAFSSGKKRSEEYRKALSLITESAKEVFGEHIDSSFVEKYHNLFEQLAQGGEIAEQAFDELGRKSAIKYLESFEDSTGSTAEEMYKQIKSAIPNDLEFGVTADVEQALRNLEEAGYKAEMLAGTLESMGYVVSYEYEDHYFVDGVDSGVVGKDPAPGGNVQIRSTPKRVVTKRSGFGVTKGGGGGGGKSDYENPYDRLHNTYQKINDLLRERENLERRYQRLIDHNLATAEKMAEISKRNIQNQKEEIEKQKEIIAVRKAEVEAEIGANIGMSNYIYTETDELGNQSIRINWENISAITDEKEKERVKDFYDKIAEKLESIYEAQNALLDAEDAIWEELQQGKDEYLDLERQVKDAIINQRQKEIDELATINDSITEANSNLLESMQNQIDQYRQNRDNEKTEEEIADKQRRLAYLQQDTSGANALEILNLQKEIEESQESYTDQLIDQKITELQEQNDQAAEQRQQQIDIMQAQLDQYSQSNQIWDEVSKIIDQGTSEIGGLVKGSELESLLKTADAFEGMSKIQKMDWLNQINNQIASALVWMGQGAYTTLAEGGKVSFVNKDGKTVTGIVNDRGEVEVETDVGKAIYTDIAMDAYGNLRSSQTEVDAIGEANRQAQENEGIETKADQVATNLYGVKPSDATSKDRKEGIYVQALQAALNQMGYNAGAIDGKFGTSTRKALTAFQQSAAMKKEYPNYYASGVWDDKTNDVLRIVGYKTGGLADFTGPAWLDGTKSRPEYILNADQTKAFFSLVDVLTSLRPDSFQTTQNVGDNVYDIDINVESIGSDYDVEQLADAVKHLVDESAHYRNNNTINLMR